MCRCRKRRGQPPHGDRLRADCDRDALLAFVDANAGVCHTSAWSCFATGRAGLDAM
ncbi:MAG: phosphoribosyl-AMP cyclohydrolase [Spirochaetaceae bacterium]|nr:phosphoribosyl-AMP cyclohydrolase [Spirochaetaceae bacterium]